MTAKSKKGRVIKEQDFSPKTENQKNYIRTMAECDLTFCYGPSGTGKTMHAIKLACEYWQQGKIDKILVARPTIENSPKGLGYLKGDLNSKLEPWVLPCVEYMKQFLGKDVYYKNFNLGYIEFAPLEYMRGRTLTGSFIILDEAQNCTTSQLKMIVTRIGYGSKMVINGDYSQNDLKKHGETSDFEYMIDKIKRADLKGFGICELGASDIMRHPIIGEFLKVFND